MNRALSYLSFLILLLSLNVKADDALLSEKALYESGKTKVRLKSTGKFITIKSIKALEVDIKSKGWRSKVPKDFDIQTYKAKHTDNLKFKTTYNRAVLIYTFSSDVNIKDIIKIIRPLSFKFTFMATSPKKFPKSVFISDAEIHLDKIFRSLKAIENIVKK